MSCKTILVIFSANLVAITIEPHCFKKPKKVSWNGRFSPAVILKIELHCLKIPQICLILWTIKQLRVGQNWWFLPTVITIELHCLKITQKCLILYTIKQLRMGQNWRFSPTVSWWWIEAKLLINVYTIFSKQNWKKNFCISLSFPLHHVDCWREGDIFPFLLFKEKPQSRHQTKDKKMPPA